MEEEMKVSIIKEMKQTFIDEEHLKILSLGYMVSGIISFLFSLLGLFYAGIGIFIAKVQPSNTNMTDRHNPNDPAMVGWMFAIGGVILFIIMIALGVAKLQASSCLKKRKSRTFCMVMGGISCIGIPYGTFLGICTLTVLSRPSVSYLFLGAEPAESEYRK